MWLLDRKAKISAVRTFATQQHHQLAALPEALFRVKVSARDTMPSVRSPADLTKLFRRIAAEPQMVLVTDDTDAGAWTATTAGHLLRESGYQGELSWCPQFCVGEVVSAGALSRWRASAHERQQALLEITRGVVRKLSGALYGGQYDVSALGVFYLAQLLTAAAGTAEASVSTPFGSAVAMLSSPDAEVGRAVLIDTTEMQLTATPIGTIDLIGWMSSTYGMRPDETLQHVQDLYDRGLVSCPFDSGGGLRPDMATALHRQAEQTMPDDAATAPQYMDLAGRALAVVPNGRAQRLPPVTTRVLAAIWGCGAATQMTPNARAVVRYRLLAGDESEVGTLEISGATTVGPDRIITTALSRTSVQNPPPEIPLMVERRYGQHLRYAALLRSAVEFVPDIRVQLAEMASLVRQDLVVDTGAGWCCTAAGLIVLRDVVRHMPEFLDSTFAAQMFRRAAFVRTGRLDPDFVRDIMRWGRLRVRAPEIAEVGKCRCGGAVDARRSDHSLEGQCRVCRTPYRLQAAGRRVTLEARNDL